jgi:hypothetical protein
VQNRGCLTGVARGAGDTWLPCWRWGRRELPEMACHSCKPRGSIPTHGDDLSLLQAMWKHICSQGCPVMVARSGKHTCFPFCVRERALVAIEVAWAPFGIFPPLLRVDPTPRGRARRSHLLGIRGGETCARRVGRGVTPSRGIERAGDLFCWAGLGRSCVHDYFRRAKADVFWLMPYGYRIIGTRQLLTVNYNLPIHSAQFQLTLLED